MTNKNKHIFFLSGDKITSLLEGKEGDIIEKIRLAYLTHFNANCAIPFSSFLRFPGETNKRIIALPAYLGDGFNVAGIKWIGSCPGNVEKGLPRASAIIVLNDPESCRPFAVLEGSALSAKRTAASAALATKRLLKSTTNQSVGLIGCGKINLEVIKFLLKILPETKVVKLYDIIPHASYEIARTIETWGHSCQIQISKDVSSVIQSCQIVSIATTAQIPYIDSLAECMSGTIILHISLRDLSVGAILAGNNVVDDIDHVCREQTSLHLAEQKVGHRQFITSTLGQILSQKCASYNENDASVTIFSPFGLGILDLAVAHYAFELAMSTNAIDRLDFF